MVIDFHTHAFPDKIAPAALKKLTDNTCGKCTPYSDLTVTGLLANMDTAHIDISVVMPIVTKPTQTEHLNQWAREITTDRLISFGSISPYSDDYKRDIDFVIELGLKGLKFHPEYQNFVLDDKKMLGIYDYALNKGLILLFHAGVDLGMPEPYKSNPRAFASIVHQLGGGDIIAAHFGGHAQWDQVEEFLVGEKIYLDTSMGFKFYDREQFVRIVNAHGSERILFATDSPWSDAVYELDAFRSLPLTESQKDNILYKNAKRLLKL